MEHPFQCRGIILQLCLISFDQLLFFSPGNPVSLIIHQHYVLTFQEIRIYDSLYKNRLIAAPGSIQFLPVYFHHKRLRPVKFLILCRPLHSLSQF